MHPWNSARCMQHDRQNLATKGRIKIRVINHLAIFSVFHKYNLLRGWLVKRPAYNTLATLSTDQHQGP